VSVHARSALRSRRRRADQPEDILEPYRTTIETGSLIGDNIDVNLQWPDGEVAAPTGWVDLLDEGDSLAWPPCTHSEACVPES